MENQQYNNENNDEISLIDCIRVIRQRKKQVLAIFIAFVVIATIISFIMPKTYEASTLLEIGQIRNNPLETAKDVKVFLEQENTLRVLAPTFNVPEKKWPKLKRLITVKPLERFLYISVRGRSAEEVQKRIEAVVVLVQDRHRHILNKEKEILQDEINQIKADLAAAEERINDFTKKLARLEYPKTAAEVLLAQSYISTLNDEKANVRNYQQSLLDKEHELAYGLRETRVEVPPSKPLLPIAPKKKINIIAGAALGLFAGICYAFIAEYWEKNKYKLN